ncbi:MAG: HAD-IB family phosphatase [Bacillota bacterium]
MGPRLVFAMDFDGTITTPDATHILRDTFVPKDVAEGIRLNAAVKSPPGRDWLGAYAAYFPNDPKMLIDLVLRNTEFRPGFLEFVEWARSKGYGLATISNGYGFYVDPMLRSAGITDIEVYRNDVDFASPPRVVIGHPHPTCKTCASCKVRCVEELLRDYDRAVFVGDGLGDRFGAARSHAIFGRDKLANFCEGAGIPFTRWDDFFDIMDSVEKGLKLAEPGEWGLCPADAGHGA